MENLQKIQSSSILIVDDQKLHCLFLEKLLKNEGYSETRCLLDSMKVLSAVQDFSPDLLILDLQMPKLNGFQVMEQLIDERKKYYLPILILTEDKSSEIRIKALQSGAADVLSKPFENEEILLRISHLLETRMLHMKIESQNKILESRVQERTKELKATQLEIVQRLAQAAEFRDSETGQHIIRMSQYCAKFAEALGLSDEECELILTASPLHDIGKIGISDNILLKKGKLTVEEFDIMKTHTTLGAQLLSRGQSPMMKMAQVIALSHHEKWDGSGYPKGLSRNDIPRVGQLCSVCDVFDALTSERPYKKAWSIEDAVAEIVKQKNRQFDPKLVDRFVEILSEIKSIKQRYLD